MAVDEIGFGNKGSAIRGLYLDIVDEYDAIVHPVGSCRDEQHTTMDVVLLA
jgi:hypothetical protein